MGKVLKTGNEVRVNGRVKGGEEGNVLGKIKFICKKFPIGDCGGFIVCTEGEINEETARELALSAPSAVILSQENEKLARFPTEAGIPVFIPDEDGKIRKSLEGRLALIDTANGYLAADLCLDTIEEYRERVREPRRGLSVKNNVIYEDMPKGYGGCSDGNGGAYFDASVIASAGDFFEGAAYLAERFCESGLTVALPLHEDTEERKEDFLLRAEALFRAAVFGNLSVMLTNIRRPERASRGFDEIYKSFCRLEEEGREFNGYVPRGLYIDTPALLFCASELPASDFLCFDFDRLFGLLSGENPKEAGSVAKNADTLCRFWEKWKKDNEAVCKSAQLQAKSDGLWLEPFFCDWAEFMNIKEIYTPGNGRFKSKNT